MDMTTESCRRFVEVLASSAAAPGGGGAAALVGAVGAALGNMSGSLTVGKPRFAAVDQELRELMQVCTDLQEQLLNQVGADAQGFLPLVEAYSLPKDHPNRDAILERAKVSACAVPMKIMELSARALECIAVFAEKCSRIVVSDAACGAVCCKAALQAASLNIFVNTKSMKDREAAEFLNTRTRDLLDRYCALADAVFASVTAELVPEKEQ